MDIIANQMRASAIVDSLALDKRPTRRGCVGEEDDMPEKGHLGSELQQRNRKTERMNINHTKGATSMYSNRGQNKYHNCLGCRGGGSNLTIHLDINLGLQMKDVV